MDVPVYVTENQQGRRQTLHQNQLFLIKKVNPEEGPQTALWLFNVASTQIGSEALHHEMPEASTPLIELQAQACMLNVDAQDIQVLKLCKLMTSVIKTLRAIYAGWWLKE